MNKKDELSPGWVAIGLAPFWENDERWEWQSKLERDLVTYANDLSVAVAWSKGTIHAEVRYLDEDNGEICVPSAFEAHPSVFASAAGAQHATWARDGLSHEVEAFWTALAAAFDDDVQAERVKLYGRGGPHATVGFRRLPKDVWRASQKDWVAGTCKTPDGHVWYSIHAEFEGLEGEMSPICKKVSSSTTPRVKLMQTMHPVQAGDRLNTTEAAAYCGLGKSTLDKLRVTGGGPLHFKLGKRVVYAKDALDAWIVARQRSSTSSTFQS